MSHRIVVMVVVMTIDVKVAAAVATEIAIMIVATMIALAAAAALVAMAVEEATTMALEVVIAMAQAVTIAMVASVEVVEVVVAMATTALHEDHLLSELATLQTLPAQVQLHQLASMTIAAATTKSLVHKSWLVEHGHYKALPQIEASSKKWKGDH